MTQILLWHFLNMKASSPSLEGRNCTRPNQPDNEKGGARQKRWNSEKRNLQYQTKSQKEEATKKRQQTPKKFWQHQQEAPQKQQDESDSEAETSNKEQKEQEPEQEISRKTCNNSKQTQSSANYQASRQQKPGTTSFDVEPQTRKQHHQE